MVFFRTPLQRRSAYGLEQVAYDGVRLSRHAHPQAVSKQRSDQLRSSGGFARPGWALYGQHSARQSPSHPHDHLFGRFAGPRPQVGRDRSVEQALPERHATGQDVSRSALQGML
jgi:hypothetical protein